MQRSYLDYAMSVIVSRAIPDIRDGLKPVHRRILYAMREGGYEWNRPYRKSARVVGDVMGKYHPHGDAAIYDAMVRMAQPFAMRLMLIDGQGNFGSMDGDPPAAMRYTEVRLARTAHEMLEDIDKETVDFQSNYDDSSREPQVVPSRIPNFLVNGASGIAVGMATNVPTHNLGEVIDALLALVADPEIDIDSLMTHLPGPDFPTGGIIMGKAGIRSAYHTGRGSVVIRGRVHFEEIRKDREAIIITEVPFQVNKALLLERIADAVRSKRIEGISDLRDESDRDGVRMVIELKRDAMAEIVLNQLYKYTALQSSFGVNMLGLNGGRPELLNLKQVLAAFLAFREEVIARRTVHELGKARDRAHILIGLAIAVANIDSVIALIRAAPDPNAAREGLMARPWPVEAVAELLTLIESDGGAARDGDYYLSEAQARAILDLRLQRLTGLERDKIDQELKDLVARIAEYLEILESRERLLEVLREELVDIKEAYGDERRTDLQDAEFEQDIEDLIQRDDMVVTVSHGGYIKRVPLSTYRAQRRGGKGRSAMATRDEDFVSQVYAVNTHTPMLFFSSAGQVYKLKVYKLPLGTPQARGKALVNLLPLDEGETISTVMPLPEDETAWNDLHVMFATSRGNVRRNALSDFVNVKANGKIAMKLENDERLVGVATCAETDDVLLAARGGKCIRFPITDVRVFSGRNSTGVRGIGLAEGDAVISMSILRHFESETEERDDYLRAVNAKRRLGGADYTDRPEDKTRDAELAARLIEPRFAELAETEQFILGVTENGFGKMSSSHEYRTTGRGGKGIVNIEATERNGPVVASFPVADGDQIMMVTDGGQLIRSPVDDIRIAARGTQGVTLLRVAKNERVVSVARLDEESEDGAADGDAAGEDGAPTENPEGNPDDSPNDSGGHDSGGEDSDG